MTFGLSLLTQNAYHIQSKEEPQLTTTAKVALALDAALAATAIAIGVLAGTHILAMGSLPPLVGAFVFTTAGIVLLFVNLAIVTCKPRDVEPVMPPSPTELSAPLPPLELLSMDEILEHIEAAANTEPPHEAEAPNPFDLLPDELLLEVLSFTPQRPSLHLVCKRWNRVLNLPEKPADELSFAAFKAIAHSRAQFVEQVWRIERSLERIQRGYRLSVYAPDDHILSIPLRRLSQVLPTRVAAVMARNLSFPPPDQLDEASDFFVTALVEAYLNEGHYIPCLRHIQNMPAGILRDKATWHAVAALSEEFSGLICHSLAATIEDAQTRNGVLAYVSGAFAAEGNQERALDTFDHITSLYRALDAIRLLVKATALTGEFDTAKTQAHDLILRCKRRGHQYYRDYILVEDVSRILLWSYHMALAEVALAQISFGLIGDAITTCEGIRPDTVRRVYIAAARAKIRLGRIEEAAELANKSLYRGGGDVIRMECVFAHYEKGRLEELKPLLMDMSFPPDYTLMGKNAPKLDSIIVAAVVSEIEAGRAFQATRLIKALHDSDFLQPICKALIEAGDLRAIRVLKESSQVKRMGFSRFLQEGLVYTMDHGSRNAAQNAFIRFRLEAGWIREVPAPLHALTLPTDNQ